LACGVVAALACPMGSALIPATCMKSLRFIFDSPS
jgi:hypothetical protein